MKNISYNYKKFNIENHNITFSTDGEGVLISIPFADDTPHIIKNKLDEMIDQGINEWLENEILEGCMPTAENLLLNARMQINYCYGEKPQYYIDVTITELFPEVGMGVEIDKTCNIQAEDSELWNEFVAYCRYQLDKILFSVY